MDYEAEILKEEGVIKQLQSARSNLKLPRRTIDWQFKNARYGNRNPTRQRFIIKKQRRVIGQKVGASQSRIVSLRTQLLNSLIPVKD